MNFKNCEVYASLSEHQVIGIRISGPGLGNLLFPWARAVVFAHKHNLKMLSTSWSQYNIGPYLRKEDDKRRYNNLFYKDGKNGLAKIWSILSKRTIDEVELVQGQFYKDSLIVFNGLGAYFEGLIEHNELISESLLKIIRRNHLEVLEGFQNNAIAVHVRLGDFAEPPSMNELKRGAWNYRIPLDWYVYVIRQVREYIGKDVPVYVFSDGSYDQLNLLIRENNVELKTFGSAISDMIAISKCRLLIGSGSTYSMWGSFLGQVPSLWFPGLMRTNLLKNGLEYEIDYDQHLPNEIAKYLENSFAQPTNIKGHH